VSESLHRSIRNMWTLELMSLVIEFKATRVAGVLTVFIWAQTGETEPTLCPLLRCMFLLPMVRFLIMERENMSGGVSLRLVLSGTPPPCPRGASHVGEARQGIVVMDMEKRRLIALGYSAMPTRSMAMEFHGVSEVATNWYLVGGSEKKSIYNHMMQARMMVAAMAISKTPNPRYSSNRGEG